MIASRQSRSSFILAINFIGLDRIWRFDLNQY
jgi:hypothetical protein